MSSRFFRLLAVGLAAMLLLCGVMPALAEAPVAKAAKIVPHELYEGDGEQVVNVQGMPYNAVPVSISSSNTKVLTVRLAGKTVYDYKVKPKKAGSAKVTVKYKVGKKAYSISATYKVLSFPKPLKALTIKLKNSKNKVTKTIKVNLNTYTQTYMIPVKKNYTAAVKMETASGWKCNGITFDTGEYYDGLNAEPRAAEVNDFILNLNKPNFAMAFFKNKATGKYAVYAVAVN